MFGELVREMATIGKIENEMSVMELVDLDQLIDDLTLSIENRIYSTRTLLSPKISRLHKFIFQRRT